MPTVNRLDCLSSGRIVFPLLLNKGVCCKPSLPDSLCLRCWHCTFSPPFPRKMLGPSNMGTSNTGFELFFFLLGCGCSFCVLPTAGVSHLSPLWCRQCSYRVSLVKRPLGPFNRNYWDPYLFILLCCLSCLSAHPVGRHSFPVSDFLASPYKG